MSKFNFDAIINRRGTDCLKWDHYDLKDELTDVIPMWIADMDFIVPSYITEAVRARLDHGIFGYTAVSQSYYDALISWWSKRFIWTIDREWILPCPGVVPAINFAIRALTAPGDKIIIQPPVYHPFRYAVSNNSRTLVNNPLKKTDAGYEMDFAGLKRLMIDKSSGQAKMLILSSPHNPVGRVWNAEELKTLVELCAENRVIIVSDEIHCDIIMPGHSHTPTASIGKEAADITITLVSPSKTFNIAEMQTANCIVPDNGLYSALKGELVRSSMTKPNLLGLIACQAAYEHGQEWVTELNAYVRKNYDLMKSFLEAELPRVGVERMEGTYLGWLDFRAFGMTHAETEMHLLKKARVALSPGRIFGAEGEGFFRINLACPSTTLNDALQRISNAFKDI